MYKTIGNLMLLILYKCIIIFRHFWFKGPTLLLSSYYLSLILRVSASDSCSLPGAAGPVAVLNLSVI